MPARKRCGKCKKLLPLDKFHRNRTKAGGLHDYCKPCQLAKIKDYESRVGGKHVLNRAYRYGLTRQEVKSFLQIPVCQSCGQRFSGSADQHFDHCHTNTHVRGVICSACNMACRGTAEEAIARLLFCVAYLRRDLERTSELV